MCGVGAIEELEKSSVRPSGAAVATARAAMVPLAPSRFSMTNDCLRSAASCCAMVRAWRSGPGPVLCGRDRCRADTFPRIVRGLAVRDSALERLAVFQLDLGVASGVLRR